MRKSCQLFMSSACAMTLAVPVLLGAPHASAFASASEDTGFTVSVKGVGAFGSSLPADSVATYVLRPGSSSVQEWRTTPDGDTLGDKITAQPAIRLGSSASGPALAVDPGDQRQAVTGFGAALTDSSAALIHGSAARDTIMADLFGPSGARFTYVRLPMGASDMQSAPFASYDDTAGDTSLAHFSVAHDTANIIPLLQQAKQLQPGLKIIATPWSAPGWMKTGGTFDGDCGSDGKQGDTLNTLKPADYGVYAKYLAKFVAAYARYGLPVSLVSMQNEPGNCNSSYPTMNLTESDEAKLAPVLRRALDAAGEQSTGIEGYDDNWYHTVSGGAAQPDPDPANLVRDAGGDLAAIGYHCYKTGGKKYPFDQQISGSAKLAILMTECTGLTDYPQTSTNLVNGVLDDILGPIQYHASGSVYWNFALNSSGGPHIGGSADSRGMVTVDGTGAGDWHLSQDYYYWAQFSKFVDPGALVLGSTFVSGGVYSVAFRNPDGTIVVVALNSN